MQWTAKVHRTISKILLDVLATSSSAILELDFHKLSKHTICKVTIFQNWLSWWTIKRCFSMKFFFQVSTNSNQWLLPSFLFPWIFLQNLELTQDARAARAYRDELDVYKEMALKSRQLEVEVTKYKEKMNEMDYLSKRVEVTVSITQRVMFPFPVSWEGCSAADFKFILFAGTATVKIVITTLI